MKIRQAKKIILGKHWARRWKELRPTYYDEERQVWVSPSWHDMPNKTWQKARRKYFGAAKKFYNRHGYCFDEHPNKKQLEKAKEYAKNED